MTVLLVQMDPSSKLVGNTSSKLDRCSLTSRRTTGKMSQRRCDKDQRRRKDWHIISGTHGRKNLIGPSILFSKLLIQKYNDKSGQWQQKKNPFMSLSVTGYCLQRKRKQCAGSSYDTSCNDSKNQPLDQI